MDEFKTSPPTIPHHSVRWLIAVVAALSFAAPAPAQQRFKERKSHVRVAIQHEVTALAIEGRGVYQVIASSGRPLTQIQSYRPYFIQITKGQPGGRVYRLVLQELERHQERLAISLAMNAKEAYQLPVKVWRIPAREAGNDRIIVTLGEFATLQAARDYIPRLPRERIRYIYEERGRAEKGEVRLVDRGGQILARDSRYLRAVPLDLAQDSLAVAQLDNDWSPGSCVKARNYRGDVELTMNESGTLTAVNDLWIEYYLYSVVAGEMGADAPLESLKAQAVAARSEAVAKYEHGIVTSSLFDCFDTAMAQVYRGKGDEAAVVRQAVDATRGEILVCNGEPVDAVYSHSCGGYIATAQDLWDGVDEGWSRRGLDILTANTAPDLASGDAVLNWMDTPIRSLCDPNQVGFPKYLRETYHWTKTYSGDEFSRIASAFYGTGRVRGVSVERRSPSGRVRRLRIVGERKTVTVSREMEIRELMGNCYSTFFACDTDQDSQGRLSRLTLRGAGFGHGVGMCQMGAYMMALHGYNYRQILGHYYHNVKIRQLYR
ncbi:MAG: SpoIID/LytB domain-containing protein [bacterium]|nr:SpoIID/LytB domain-containing protein [bacterium]